MKKVLSIILILVGILFIVMPSIKDKIVKHKTKEVKEILDNISYDNILENEKLEGKYNYDAIEDVGPLSVIFSSVVFDERNLIGKLKIPDLNMELPLLKGLTNSNLSVGATTMKSGQIMGKGNYPVSGHNMKNKELLFGSLMDIELGAIVYITDKSQIYEYEIYDIVIVQDTAMYMIEDKESKKRGKPIISLMTCYYSSETGKRFFALGELIDQYPMKYGNMN